MHTSMRISATSFFSKHSKASRAELGLEQILAHLGEHDLVAQQLRLAVVDQQNIDLVGSAHELDQRCSHIRSADISC